MIEPAESRLGSSRRGGRARTSRSARQTTNARPISKVRGIKPAEFLTQQQIDLVHDYSMRVLEKTGIEFMLPEALDILEANGCRINRENGRAYMPRAMVEEWIAKAPSHFHVQGMTEESRIMIGGDNIAFGSVASAPNTYHVGQGRQTGSQEGFRDLPQFYNYVSENIHQISVKCKLGSYDYTRRRGLPVHRTLLSDPRR